MLSQSTYKGSFLYVYLGTYTEGNVFLHLVIKVIMALMIFLFIMMFIIGFNLAKKLKLQKLYHKFTLYSI